MQLCIKKIFNVTFYLSWKVIKLGNKKVLLRERKRHTARRVVSTPSVVLTGYPPGRVPPRQGTPPGPDLARRGTLCGYPSSRVPPVLTWPGGTLPGYTPWQGTLQQGTPWQGTPGRVPHRQGTPHAGYPLGRVPPWTGYPPRLDLAGYPPRCLPHGILGNVAKHYGIWVHPQVWTD